MILGSHNTMSYAAPLVWWRRLLRPFYRCQAKTLEGQIAAGVRWFDIRVAQDGDGRFVCAHGGTLLDADPVDAIETIESLASTGSVVRVVLERCDSIKTAEDFAGLCEWLEEFMPGGAVDRRCAEARVGGASPFPRGTGAGASAVGRLYAAAAGEGLVEAAMALLGRGVAVPVGCAEQSPTGPRGACRESGCADGFCVRGGDARNATPR